MASRQSKYTVHETITVSTSSIGLTTASIAGKNLAVITVESQPVRMRPDADPTTTVGHVLNDRDIVELHNLEEMQAIRFIRDGAVDATLSCSYGIG